MVNITNAWVTAFAADVPDSFFGPATRVTDVESPQLTNEDYFDITVAHGYGGIATVYINYDQLIDPDLYRKVILAAVIDDWADAYPAPYGPLERITTEDELYTDDGYQHQHFVMALEATYGNQFYITYDQLKQPALLDDIVEKAAGIQAIVAELRTSIESLRTYSNGLSAPYEQSELAELGKRITALSKLAGHPSLL